MVPVKRYRFRLPSPPPNHMTSLNRSSCPGWLQRYRLRQDPRISHLTNKWEIEGFLRALNNPGEYSLDGILRGVPEHWHQSTIDSVIKEVVRLSCGHDMRPNRQAIYIQHGCAVRYIIFKPAWFQHRTFKDWGFWAAIVGILSFIGDRLNH